MSQDAPNKTGFTDREVADFLLRACHDLRGPIRAIRAYSELLNRDQKTQPPADFEERLGFIVQGAANVDRLVEGLSRYSIALQIDPGTFRPAPLDILLRSVLAKLERELRGCGAEVTYGELPTVPGNQDRLMEVLEHLLRNSVVHRAGAPPRIHVSAESRPEEWLLQVRDNGPGVDPAELTRIFEPFQRPGKDRTGPGLGLTICRTIVEKHGGKIWAESTPGEGCSILFTLPAE